jgi:CubicO group peptidase (beta-lactamase class C family)
MSTEAPRWLVAACEYIGRFLSYQRRVTEVPGYAIAIRHGSQLMLDECEGWRDERRREPLRAHHLFRVASHSKSFSAAGIMVLAGAGRLQLTDRLDVHLDDLPEGLREVTIEQLLSHAAGLARDTHESSYWSMRRAFASNEETAGDIFRGLTIPPGIGLKYSNLGYALVGQLIEAVTGESYVNWMRREVVAAAGLTESYPDLDAESQERLASGHSARLPSGKRIAIDGAITTSALAAAAGFISHPRDLTKFFAQLSERSGTSFLSVESRQTMNRSLQSERYSDKTQHYGLGIMMGDVADESWFGHGGGFPGFISKTSVLPERDLAISVCTNAVDGKAHAWVDAAVSVIVAMANFADKEDASSSADGWTGRWWNLWGVVDLLRIGEVVLLASPEATQPLDHCPRVRLLDRDVGLIEEASSFHHFGEHVRLERDLDGVPIKLWIAGDYWLPEQAYLSLTAR